MKYLIETTEVYRVDNEDEAKVVVEEAKKSSTVSKYNCVFNLSFSTLNPFAAFRIA